MKTSTIVLLSAVGLVLLVVLYRFRSAIFGTAATSSVTVVPAATTTATTAYNPISLAPVGQQSTVSGSGSTGNSQLQTAQQWTQFATSTATGLVGLGTAIAGLFNNSGQSGGGSGSYDGSDYTDTSYGDSSYDTTWDSGDDSSSDDYDYGW